MKFYDIYSSDNLEMQNLKQNTTSSRSSSKE